MGEKALCNEANSSVSVSHLHQLKPSWNYRVQGAKQSKYKRVLSSVHFSRLVTTTK